MSEQDEQDEWVERARAATRDHEGAQPTMRHECPRIVEGNANVVYLAADERCPTPGCGFVAGGVKGDTDKPRYDLLPVGALRAMADVLTFGARKYAPDNWRRVEGWRWRYCRAALGHLLAWHAGERLDPESGLPHLGHALCCVAFLCELDIPSGPDVEGSEPRTRGGREGENERRTKEG